MEATLPVAILGAGPVGLAAAAHLVQRHITPLILEAGGQVGANLADYHQVRLFSPWQFNIDRAARALLEAAGWQAPAADGLPTAGEILDDYLAPLARLPQIAPHLHLRHRVVQVSRSGFDKVKTAGRGGAPFVLRVDTPDGMREFRAAAIIDATGTWSQANPLGANGLPALGELEHRARIVYGMPDILGTQRERFAGKRVLVVGAGHSATGNLLALASLAEQAPGTQIAWAVRGHSLAKSYGGGEADQLAARGQLGIRLKALQTGGKLEVHRAFRIASISSSNGSLRVAAEPHDATTGAQEVIEGIDVIVAATGARPDHQMTRELRVRLDPWLESTDALAPLIDPNLHSCGTVRPHGHRELAHPEPGYYAVGAKSYGRAPNFLMATGYEQVRSVVAMLAGDQAAADDVQLELPETGVCITRPLEEEGEDGGASCCAPAEASSHPPSCCAKPAEVSNAASCCATPAEVSNAASCCGTPVASSQASSCCGGPAPADAAACCVKDAELKSQGKSGCGSTRESCAA